MDGDAHVGHLLEAASFRARTDGFYHRAARPEAPSAGALPALRRAPAGPRMPEALSRAAFRDSRCEERCEGQT